MRHKPADSPDRAVRAASEGAVLLTQTSLRSRRPHRPGGDAHEPSAVGHTAAGRCPGGDPLSSERPRPTAPRVRARMGRIVAPFPLKSIPGCRGEVHECDECLVTSHQSPSGSIRPAEAGGERAVGALAGVRRRPGRWRCTASAASPGSGPGHRCAVGPRDAGQLNLFEVHADTSSAP